MSKKLLGAGGFNPAQPDPLIYQAFASQDTTGVVTHTFNNMSFGAEIADRRVVVIVHVFNLTSTGNPADVSSVTIGGFPAALIIDQTTSTGPTYTGIWYAHASGTSGTVSVTCPYPTNSCGVSTYSFVNPGSMTPQISGWGTEHGIVLDPSASWSDVTLLGTTAANSTNPSWTNATKNYGVDIRSNEWASGAIGTVINTYDTISTDAIVDSYAVVSWRL